MEYFIDSYETLKGRNIEEEDREFLQRKFDKMYVTKDIYAIYNKLLAVCGRNKWQNCLMNEGKSNTKMEFRCCM